MTVDIFIAVFAALASYMAFKGVVSYMSYQFLGFDLFDDSPEINVYVNVDPTSQGDEPDEEQQK